MKLLLLLLQSVWLIASTLHLSASSNPARLNPLIATDSASSSISGFVFNSLVKYDESGQKIIGDLAESYRFITPTLIEFKLRRGVKWHDGKPFTSRDVLFTYNLIKSPTTITPYASDFRVIKHVKILDEYTLRVVYEKPYFKALEIWMMGIVPSHILKNEKDIMG
ncbi:MAG: ABC transporter substrate-binding protein, partial [Sulfuricurvum sp.]|uniref:ABC transporter substrate-binding protein n=1 Tax=Sulfuricurvum sp. TaxID=2025608 RepID=UPI0027377002